MTSDDRITPDVQECARRMIRLYDGIARFQRKSGRLPQWLSDLYPTYIPDTSFLICPAAPPGMKNPLANDPKIPTNYEYQFAPVSLSGLPFRHLREWLFQEMKNKGEIVPVLRCWCHQGLNATLNISFDGRLYISPSGWQSTIENPDFLASFSAELQRKLRIPVGLKAAWWLTDRM